MGNILWLASYPKSGNTWMRAFIQNFFSNAQEPMQINEIGGGGITTAANKSRWFEALDTRPPSEWTTDEINQMRAPAQKVLADSFPSSVFCKTHAPVMFLDGHPTINLSVSSGAIYMVRNPLDVAVSFADFQGISIDDAITLMATPSLVLPRMGEEINEVLGSWSENVDSWTGRPNPGLHVVRYEDLHIDASETFGGVLEFLGMKAPRERMERAIRHATFKELRHQEDKVGFSERSAVQDRFFRKGKTGGWRDLLSEEQVARMVNAHREQMARFGYVPKGV